MTKGIQVVVGEFQLLERNELAAPVRTGSGRVWVHVEPSGHSGLCLSRHRPAEPRKDGTIRDRCVTDPRARVSNQVTEGVKNIKIAATDRKTVVSCFNCCSNAEGSFNI